MKRFVPGCQCSFYRYGIYLKGFLKTCTNLIIILHWGGRLESRKFSIKQKLLMVKAFNQNFSVSKTYFCTEFSKIWHSIWWRFLLFKLPKEIKDAKENISMYYKTSQTLIRVLGRNLIFCLNFRGTQPKKCFSKYPWPSTWQVRISIANFIFLLLFYFSFFIPTYPKHPKC